MGTEVRYRVWQGVPGGLALAVVGYTQDPKQASAVGRFFTANQVPHRIEFVGYTDGEETHTEEIGRSLSWHDARTDELPDGPIRRSGWEDRHVRAVPTDDHNSIGPSYAQIGPRRYRLYLWEKGERTPYEPTEEDRSAKDWCWA